MPMIHKNKFRQKLLKLLDPQKKTNSAKFYRNNYSIINNQQKLMLQILSQSTDQQKLILQKSNLCENFSPQKYKKKSLSKVFL